MKLLKWVGGKAQIMTHVSNVLSKHKKAKNYHEPFVGGGSVLFEVLRLRKEGVIDVGKVYASDANGRLIEFYETLRTNPSALYEHLNRHVTLYESLNGQSVNRRARILEEGMTSKESYYYYVRHLFNDTDMSVEERAALFLFINKTCFRGLWREGPNGYNVPYGHYKVFPNISLDDIKTASDEIRDVVFTCQGYADSLKKVKKGDLVYADPPYAPEQKNSFVGYTGDGFEDHEALFEALRKVSSKAGVVMSNAKVPLVTDAFDDTWTVMDVVARRAIHSKDPSKTTHEVILFKSLK
jgi:DNA adenine methylase